MKVIYHSADFDGIFCREIAKKFLPDLVEEDFIGWNYGDPVPQVSSDELIYMLDISIDELMNHPQLIWIDHHKTAMEKYPTSIRGVRIDGVAACRLVWQWFTNKRSIGDELEEGKQFLLKDYVERSVTEPWAVRLVGEYDVWDKRNPDAELFQHGLRSQELSPADWNTLFEHEHDADKFVIRLLIQGRAVQYATTEANKKAILSGGFTLFWEGLTFLACNHASFNSFLFVAGLDESHDACLGFAWKKNKWSVSMYHKKGREDIDLSEIAKKYGGGGHRGACGFVCEALPFELKQTPVCV